MALWWQSVLQLLYLVKAALHCWTDHIENLPFEYPPSTDIFLIFNLPLLPSVYSGVFSNTVTSKANKCFFSVLIWTQRCGCMCHEFSKTVFIGVLKNCIKWCWKLLWCSEEHDDGKPSYEAESVDQNWSLEFLNIVSEQAIENEMGANM